MMFDCCIGHDPVTADHRAGNWLAFAIDDLARDHAPHLVYCREAPKHFDRDQDDNDQGTTEHQ